MNPLLKGLGLYSIQGRLTAIAFFFIIATAATLGIAGYRFTVDFETGRYRDHFSLLAAYLASNAELGVLLENQQILAQLCDTMLKVHDVRRVAIVDGQGRLLIQRRQANDQGADLLRVTAPVIVQNLSAEDAPFLSPQVQTEPLGEVQLDYAQSGLEQLQRTLAWRFLLLAPLLAIVPAILYWRVSRAVRAPLKAVLYLADEVARGRTQTRAASGDLYETQVMAKALNDMLDALELQKHQLEEANQTLAHQQVLAEVGKFSMVVAHEIKNPLAVIKGSLSILRKQQGSDPAVREEMMGYVDEEILRVNKLVEDFLLFARPRTPVLSEMMVLDLLANLDQRLRLFDRRVKVRVEVPAELMEAPLRCDISLLERALYNVVRNGLETGSAPVLVVIDAQDHQLCFRVQDQGPGFAPDQLTQIFEPFFSTKAKGTGLGLAIAKEVLTAHQGHISADNCADGGACVQLCLPLALAPNGSGPSTPDQQGLNYG